MDGDLHIITVFSLFLGGPVLGLPHSLCALCPYMEQQPPNHWWVHKLGFLFCWTYFILKYNISHFCGWTKIEFGEVQYTICPKECGQVHSCMDSFRARESFSDVVADVKAHSRPSSSHQSCWMGLRSGPAQLFNTKLGRTFLVPHCQCWNSKEPPSNCCHKVGITLRSKMSCYVVQSRKPKGTCIHILSASILSINIMQHLHALMI